MNNQKCQLADKSRRSGSQNNIIASGGGGELKHWIEQIEQNRIANGNHQTALTTPNFGKKIKIKIQTLWTLCFAAAALLQPEAVGEGLHCVLGDAVGAGAAADSAEHAGHVHHPAPGLLDERQHAECHGYHPIDVDLHHAPVVLEAHPIPGRRGRGHPRVVHHRPQTWGTHTHLHSQLD